MINCVINDVDESSGLENVSDELLAADDENKASEQRCDQTINSGVIEIITRTIANGVRRVNTTHPRLLLHIVRHIAARHESLSQL